MRLCETFTTPIPGTCTSAAGELSTFQLLSSSSWMLTKVFVNRVKSHYLLPQAAGTHGCGNSRCHVIIVQSMCLQAQCNSLLGNFAAWTVIQMQSLRFAILFPIFCQQTLPRHLSHAYYRMCERIRNLYGTRKFRFVHLSINIATLSNGYIPSNDHHRTQNVV